MSSLLVMHNTKTGSVCGLLRVSYRVSISMHVFGEGCGSKSAYIAFYISLRDCCVIDADGINDANYRDTGVCDANFCGGDSEAGARIARDAHDHQSPDTVIVSA